MAKCSMFLFSFIFNIVKTLKDISIQTLINNLHDNGGHPNETDDGSDRSLYIEEFTRRGVDNILKELGKGLTRKSLYRNRYTGDEETLEDLIFPDEYGVQHRGESEDTQIMFALENWIPAVGRNTIKEQHELEGREVRLSDNSTQPALL